MIMNQHVRLVMKKHLQLIIINRNEKIIKTYNFFTVGIPLLLIFSLFEERYNNNHSITPQWIKDGRDFFDWLKDV